MNVLFVIPHFEMASSRYRVLQYIQPLENLGIHCDVVSAPKTIAGKLRLWINARKYDTVFVQKKLFQPWEAEMIRRFAQRLIYDLDDAVMVKDRMGDDGQPIPERKFPATAKRADLIVAGNEYLREQTLPFNPNVSVIPTPIDLKQYSLKEECAPQSEIAIGWIGSKATLKYLKDIQPALDAIGARYPNVKLHIVADEFFDCSSIPVVKERWSHEREIELLHRFDIGIMPLPDNVWTRGKCGFKLLQYMAVEVPSVCSPVGVNLEIVNHEVNGLWATTIDEWIERLSRLIENPSLRSAYGLAGRRTVESRYSLEINTHRLAQLIKGSVS